MKKLFSIMSVTLMLMIAAVNTANAQTTYQIVVNYSNPSYDQYLVGTYGGFDTNGNGYVTADLSCTPKDPTLYYYWSGTGHSGTSFQIYPNLTYDYNAYLYIWAPSSGGSMDLKCEVKNSSGTIVGTATIRFVVL